ncbi:ribonuclease J1 [Lactobacillus delbrueckii]|uniref:Ribonuclease J n=1 Tax=Lactobacillus delbrueckii subsp. bulgaricus (strain ATCC 11842 / DSM 20081 / BCRC 10696 / JCM 1002 / NBRC 13953 / NCIMB 11778 / NCTC 12712 / WDCM 00102 / Lb 14) TaxID=390333 RepID=Q1GAR6_LACDA|nr:ribonuclease J [Lactobacillus delbrueckii]ABJ58319.1 RNase J1 [Lactobacillus delbrueckii subsp. bulgaricus ATCC BAA-365]ALT47154.1 ribonuclease J [Lactobacillus delbrueckii subsp. bulgaricus]EHE89143.1 Hydrolase acting on ester bonds [Lactobacillus delbrueckii subsp. bulgaricus CNCM I-1519]KRN38979.1 metallo-beta-lactamase hydrolase [Lactobacillus delbrueckii subsp. bulgaricus ATCC 11842 = JCM 1002]MBT8804554.1 ribonuclease J [Lactobacillus delbrueckii subsp. bulgaricus]
MKIKQNEVAVFAIGGLHEIGRNMYCVQYQDEIVIMDCGIKFPEDDLLGINYVISDYSYLVKNREKIKALVVSHGHEDHIGGIPFLLEKIPEIPVYATPFALALIKSKCEEHGILDRTELHEEHEDTVLTFDKLKVTFFRTTHSIPDTLGIAVHTPLGAVVFTGDFKFDLTPVMNQPAPNFQRMAQLGEEGVLALLSDSTNAEVPQFTKSERFVAGSLHNIITGIEGRIIFATFASNLYRVSTAIQAAIDTGRKVAIFGRSMENGIQNGIDLGYLDVPEGLIVDAETINSLPPEKVMLLCTGSQGEPLAALSRIANGTHRQIKLKPHDTVIFSSNPIPGNTLSVNQLINKLMEGGANVVHGRVNNVHTSGHGGQEELKLMVELAKPKYMIPVHGEYRMQVVHAHLAQQAGVPAENTFVLKNGEVVCFSPEGARIAGDIHVKDVFVDTSGADDVGNIVVRDRQILSEEGLVVAVATVDYKHKRVLAGPDILSRGFVYMRESQDLINAAQKHVYHVLKTEMAKSDKPKDSEIRKAIIENLQDFLYSRTERRPMILPMLVEKK